MRIGIIGAGSAAFSLSLVRDLCLTEGLSGSTVTFMDIDKTRLDITYKLSRRYASETKSKLQLRKTLTRKVALKDADFVINTALVGGHGNQEIQREVGERHGYYRGIDSVEHNMVQDYLTTTGYNQLRFFLELARDMEEICPSAWLIQAANPVFEGCTLLTRRSKLKVVGLCHGHYGYKDIAETLGLNLEYVTCQAPGFNHCIWMTHFLYQGEDAYPLLDEWVLTKSANYWKTWNPKYSESDMAPAAIDMYRIYGLMPIGDTTRSGSWKYHTNLETKKKWYGPSGGFDSEIGWSLYLKGQEGYIAKLTKIANEPLVPVTSEFPPVKSGEQHIPIINAIVNDHEGKFQVNIPNKGMVPRVPHDVVVEVPAIVSGRGIQPIRMDALPSRLMDSVLFPRMLRMEWALDALMTGDRGVLAEILMRDPRTKSVEQAEAVIKELLALPFNKDMAEHYR